MVNEARGPGDAARIEGSVDRQQPRSSLRDDHGEEHRGKPALHEAKGVLRRMNGVLLEAIAGFAERSDALLEPRGAFIGRNGALHG